MATAAGRQCELCGSTLSRYNPGTFCQSCLITDSREPAVTPDDVTVNGTTMAQLRRRRGLTQKTMADRAGISLSIVGKLESSNRKTARIGTLTAIASVLQVPLGELLDARTRPPPLPGDSYIPQQREAHVKPPGRSNALRPAHARRPARHRDNKKGETNALLFLLFLLGFFQPNYAASALTRTGTGPKNPIAGEAAAARAAAGETTSPALTAPELPPASLKPRTSPAEYRENRRERGLRRLPRGRKSRFPDYLPIRDTGRRAHGRTKQRPACRPPHNTMPGQQPKEWAAIRGRVTRALTHPRPSIVSAARNPSREPLGRARLIFHRPQCPFQPARPKGTAGVTAAGS